MCKLYIQCLAIYQRIYSGVLVANIVFTFTYSPLLDWCSSRFPFPESSLLESARVRALIFSSPPLYYRFPTSLSIYKIACYSICAQKPYTK
jgi:hypothetical protein